MRRGMRCRARLWKWQSRGSGRRWAGALVEVLQDAVDNREEARESTGPGGEAWKEVSEERLCRGHDMSLGWIFLFFLLF